MGTRSMLDIRCNADITRTTIACGISVLARPTRCLVKSASHVCCVGRSLDLELVSLRRHTESLAHANTLPGSWACTFNRCVTDFLRHFTLPRSPSCSPCVGTLIGSIATKCWVSLTDRLTDDVVRIAFNGKIHAVGWTSGTLTRVRRGPASRLSRKSYVAMRPRAVVPLKSAA